MFSGITQGLFPVNSVSKRNGLLHYTVVLNENLIKDLKIGASVAIDGVCQTVVHINGFTVSFDAISETLAKTTLSDLFIGRKVSVERSLVFGDEIGGHEVSGHIFEKGTIIARKELTNNLSLAIQCSDRCFTFIQEKGFIALDGSSLTVGSVNKTQRSFEIHLIPETLRVTNFSNKVVGSYINIEPDMKTMQMLASIQDKFSDIQNRIEKIEKKLQNLE